jgi:hypothetical protein
MVTKTQRMKAALLLDGHTKSVLSEHLRALIRMYGIASSTDPLIDRLCYEILFLDPLMVRHFGRFQAMWGRRDSKDPTHVEWWNQLRAWIRDCIEKARAANNRMQSEMWAAYRDNTPGFYDAPTFDWPALQADPVARTQWWPQPRYREPPIIPAHHARGASGSAPGGSTRALRIFLVDPQTRVQPQRSDDYDIWHPDTVEAMRNVDVLTLPAVFAAVLALCPRGRHPRVLYGCRVTPRDPADGTDENGAIPAAVETQACLTGSTYWLRPGDTTQLATQATVSEWATAVAAVGHNTSTVVAILRRTDPGGRDTLPRTLLVHLNGNGIPMPVPAPDSNDDSTDADDDDDSSGADDNDAGAGADDDDAGAGSDDDGAGAGGKGGRGDGANDETDA